MNSIIGLFFELLQVALGRKIEFSQTPSEDEWQGLYVLSKKQALLGISYTAIEKLPSHQRPPRRILLQWYLNAEQIVSLNEKLNHKAISISKKFYKDGFRNIILKGQGIAKYYSVDNLDKYRMPGDVDIWLDSPRKTIISYVRRYDAYCNIVYHHIDFPKVEGIEVEVHFTPSWMNSYFTNKTLQHYFEGVKGKLFTQCDIDSNIIPSPSLDFNRVYILVHIYRHLFHEGIGLRQLMDYYYVLRQGFSEDERNETIRILSSLKMIHFTSAVMWVLREVFGIEDEYLLLPTNEVEGRFLLNEIIRSGNFGQYDKQLMRNRDESDLSYALRKLRRNLRFISSYPSEVLWSPLFKIWHYFWRKKMRTF